MSTLTLVRHGQASAFSHDYDRLSPLGVEQCEKLRDYWTANNVWFDEAFSGTLKRQRDSARILRGDDGFTENAAWNEYDGDGLIAKLGPVLAERHDQVRELYAAWEVHKDGPERGRHFQRVFERVTDAWVAGEAAHPDVETWAEFQGRVLGALRAVLDGPSGRNVLVVTSGGPIGVVTSQVLEAARQKAIEMNWRVRNGSLTSFVFGGGRISLDGFNATPHLTDPRLLTFR